VKTLIYALPKFDEIRSNMLVISVAWHIEESNMYFYVRDHFLSLNYFKTSYFTLRSTTVEGSEGNANNKEKEREG